MIKDLINKKILDIVKNQYESDPAGFKNFMESPHLTPYRKNIDFKQLNNKKSVLLSLFLNSDYIDKSDALEFILDKGVDLLSLVKITIKQKYLSHTANEEPEIIDFLNMCKVDEKLEEVLANYIKKQELTKVVKVFSLIKSDYNFLISSNNLNKLRDALPLVKGENKVEILFKQYSSYNDNEKMKLEDLKNLSIDERDILFNKIYKDVKVWKKEKLTKTNLYTINKLLSFLGLEGVKQNLTDNEKSNFLTLLPQHTYYKEVAKKVGMRFNSKNFTGVTWRSIIDNFISTEDEKNIYIDKNWCDLTIFADMEKSINNKYKDYNVTDALFMVSLSLMKYSFSNSIFCNNEEYKFEKRQKINKPSSQIDILTIIEKISKQEDFAIDFFKEKSSRFFVTEYFNKFPGSVIFNENLPLLLKEIGGEKIVEKILTTQYDDSFHELLKILKNLEEKEVDYVNIISNSSKIKESENFKILMKKMLDSLDPKNLIGYFFTDGLKGELETLSNLLPFCDYEDIKKINSSAIKYDSIACLINEYRINKAIEHPLLILEKQENTVFKI